MIKDIWRKFKGSVSTGLTWLGILYAYSDIVGLPREYGLASSDFPGREAVLLVLLLFASCYIVWVEIRPYVRCWRAATRPRPFSVKSPTNLAKDAVHYSEAGRDEFIAELRIPLFVQNQSDEVLRSVRARMMAVRGLVDLPLMETGATEGDIHPGMSVVFLAGTTLWPEGQIAAHPKKFVKLGAKSYKAKKQEAQFAHFILPGDEKMAFGGRIEEGAPLSVFPSTIWISAENAPPLMLQVEIVPDELSNPLRIISLHDRQNRRLEPTLADALDQPHAEGKES
ncbi:hypothetical protein [Pyruvatibacter mobilis]|uniref:hypothetical protein n=1 Tax=Pyruvatibacter mobilis TaxID=1712261 RepID=UPI003BAD5095